MSSPEPLIAKDEVWGTTGLDVTSDGRVVVGRLYLWDEPLERRADIVAGIWTEASGVMEPLEDLLTSRYDLGESLEGYHLTGVYDVTDDGRFMVGHMINPAGEDEAFLVDLGLLGDFDMDNVLDADDIDLLSQAIPGAGFDEDFDLNVDGLLNADDREFWVSGLAKTFFGDTDLDQDIDFEDFLALANSFGGFGGWAEGDSTGDGQVLFEDFLILSANFGQGVTIANSSESVPEPASSILACLSLLAGLIGYRKKRQANSHA